MSKKINLRVMCLPHADSEKGVAGDFYDSPVVPQIGSTLELPHVGSKGTLITGKVVSVNHDIMSLFYGGDYSIGLGVLIDEEEWDNFFKEVSERYASAPPFTNHSVWRPVSLREVKESLL